MRSLLAAIVFMGILGGCGLPPTPPTSSQRYQPVVPTSTVSTRTPVAATPSPASLLPASPSPASGGSGAARGWQIPSGLSYTHNGQLFTVDLADGRSIARGPAPPTSAIRSQDGTWYWITDTGIVASRDAGITAELILNWGVFQAQFPAHAAFATTLTMRQDQRAVLFNAYELTPGGPLCAAFALTIATAAVTSLDLACGITRNTSPVAFLAPDGSTALGNRRDLPDPPGIWIDSAFLFRHRQDTGGQRLNLARLLDVVWLADGRFVYSVDPGDPDLLPAIVVDAPQIVLADQQGTTQQVLATETVAFHLALVPDEQHLAFITGDDDRELPSATSTDVPRALWVVTIDGRDARKLATLPGTATDLVWYP